MNRMEVIKTTQMDGMEKEPDTLQFITTTQSLVLVSKLFMTT